MLRYVLRRFVLFIPVALVASFLSFFIIYLSPGDPAEMILERELQCPPTPEQVAAFKQEHGLDKPVVIQYLNWLAKAAQGDLGVSLKTNKPVFAEYKQKFQATLKLFLLGQVISLMIALPLGIISAVRQNSFIDHLSRLLALTGVSLPNFWLGLLFVYIFAVRLHWLPAFGYDKPACLVLPALTLGISGAMELMRLTRTSLLEVLRLNYIRTARAKGLAERVVITRHALRNALIPVITSVGLHVSHLVAGTVIVEMLFAWPGLGRFLVQAVAARDFPVIQGFVLISTLIFVVVNLIIDLLYVCLDPRVTYQAKGR